MRLNKFIATPFLDAHFCIINSQVESIGIPYTSSDFDGLPNLKPTRRNITHDYSPLVKELMRSSRTFADKKTSRLWGVDKATQQGREVFSRYHPCSQLIKIERFTDSAISGFSSYPMITEEAGLPLTQKPSHRAQPLACTRDPSQRFYGFQCYSVSYQIINPCQVLDIFINDMII